MTRIQPVKEIMCVEWTTATSTIHMDVIGRMICVLLGGGKMRTVGGSDYKEEICADVELEDIVEMTIGISMEP